MVVDLHAALVDERGRVRVPVVQVRAVGQHGRLPRPPQAVGSQLSGQRPLLRDPGLLHSRGAARLGTSRSPLHARRHFMLGDLVPHYINVPACQVAAAHRRCQGAHALQQLLLDRGRQRGAPRGPARALARLRDPSRLRHPGSGSAAHRCRRSRRARALCGVDDRNWRRADPGSPGGAARPRNPGSARGLSGGTRCPAARVGAGAGGCAGSGACRCASHSPAAALRPRSGPLSIGPLCVRVIVAAAAEDRGHARVRRARARARRGRPRAGVGARGCIAGGVAGGVERGRRGVHALGGRGQAVAQQDAGAQQTLTARVRGAARLTYVRLPRAINVKGGKGAATWLLARQL